MLIHITKLTSILLNSQHFFSFRGFVLALVIDIPNIAIYYVVTSLALGIIATIVFGRIKNGFARFIVISVIFLIVLALSGRLLGITAGGVSGAQHPIP